MNMKQKINDQDVLKIQVRFLVQLIKKVLLTYVYFWHRPLMLTAGYPNVSKWYVRLCAYISFPARVCLHHNY